MVEPLPSSVPFNVKLSLCFGLQVKKGSSMKSLIKVTCTAFIFISLMAACSEESSKTKQKTTQHKVEASTE